MKRVIQILAVLVIILFNGCEKDQSVMPSEKTLIKSEKGILCRGCGQSDFSDSDFSTENTTTDASKNGTDTTFVNSKRFKEGAPVIPTNPKQ